MVLSQFQESLFRITLIIGVASGFSYQTWKISHEYFRYTTSTLVSLQDYLDVTIVPQLGFKYKVYRGSTPYGKTLSEIFNTINKTKVLRSFSLYSQIGFHKEEFLLNSLNFVIVKPQSVTKRSPQQLYTQQWSIYDVGFNISHISFKAFGAFAQPYFRDIEGLRKTDARIDCRNIKMTKCFNSLTYTTKITKLQPPPYDTNCLTYKVYNYSSKENCISECLNYFTERHGLMIDSNVIKRSRYENSSLKLIPGFFRTMRDVYGDVHGDVEVSKESIENFWERWRRKKKSTENVALLPLLPKVIEILPSYKTHWKSCMSLCQRPDCIKESYVTIVQSTTGDFNKSPNVTVLGLYLYPPNDQTTIVTSLPKMSFVDFLTKVLTCVSFWFGFFRTSSLQIIAWVKRYNAKQNGGEYDNRIRVLEHKNRRLEYKNKTLEQNTIGINRRLHLLERAQGYTCNNLPAGEYS